MGYVKTYNEFLNEKTFHEIYKKENKWIKLLDAGKRKEVAENLFFLIQNSYAPLGGHPSVPNTNAVYDPKLYYWEAIDNNDDPDADIVLFGRKSPFGIKISGMGHDKTRNSKSELMNKLKYQLKTKGYWIEASDRVAEIFYGSNVPYVDNQKDVEKIFNQKVEWLNDKGQYKREVSKGNFHIESVFGKPVLK